MRLEHILADISRALPLDSLCTVPPNSLSTFFLSSFPHQQTRFTRNSHTWGGSLHLPAYVAMSHTEIPLVSWCSVAVPSSCHDFYNKTITKNVCFCLTVHVAAVFSHQGGAGADRAERVGCRSFAPQADRPHDHAETDAAGEIHPPGEPAGPLLLRSPRGASSLNCHRL